MLLSVFTLCVLPELRVFVCFHTFDGSEELVQGEIFNDNKPIRNINMSVDISISIWREEKAMKQLSQKTTHESAFFCQVMMNPYNGSENCFENSLTYFPIKSKAAILNPPLFNSPFYG